MADQERVTIKINVRADTSAIDRVQRKLAAMCAQAEACEKTFRDLNDRFDALDKKNRDLSKSISKNDDALKKHNRTTRDATRENDRHSKSHDRLRKRFLDAGKVAKGFSGIFKILKFAMKAAGIETLAYAAALSSVNLLLKTGQLLSRGWQASVRGVGVAAANAAAGVVALAATFAAAMRQFAAAQNVGSYGGQFAAASRGLRAMQGDAQLAVFGVQALTGAFSAASKNARVTGQTVTGLRGLADFAATSGDMEKGLQAAAQVISLLQAGKASGGQEMLNAAKELGPEFEKAYKAMVEGGKKSNDELIASISSGELARQAGIEGAAGQVSGTLIGQLKSFGTEIQVLFGDIGNNFLPKVQAAFQDIREIIFRTVFSITGNLQSFASGPFVDSIVGAVDKIGTFTAKLFNEYLPMTQEVMTNFANGWKRFTGFFAGTTEKFSGFLNRFSEASSIINEFFGKIIKGFSGGASRGFESFAESVVTNKDRFLEFGDALRGLVESFMSLTRAIRESFMKALPVITGLVEALSTLIEGLGVAVGFVSGTGSLGAAGMLAAPLLMSGKGKKARGKFANSKAGQKMGAGKGYGNKAIGVAGGAFAAFSLGSTAGYNVQGAGGMGLGVLGGAASGALAGSMFGLVGAGVGAAIGGIVGGIGAWLGSRKFTDEVRESADEFAGSYGELVQDQLISKGYLDTAEQKLGEFNQQIQEQAAILKEGDVFGAQALQSWEKEYATLSKSVDRARGRTRDLAKITGMSTDEIKDMAMAMDIDLSDPLLTLQEIMRETGLVVGAFGDDFNAVMSGTLGAGLAGIRQRRDLISSSAAIDEVTQTFVEASRSGAVTDDMRLALIEQAAVQSMLMGGGDPLRALDYFIQNLGNAGIQFGPGGSLAGQAGADLLAGQGEGAIDEFVNIGLTGLVDQIAANIITESAAIGVAVNRDQLVTQLSMMSPERLLQAGMTARDAGFIAAEYDPSDPMYRGEDSGVVTRNIVDGTLSKLGLSQVGIETLETAGDQLDNFVKDMVAGVEDPMSETVRTFDSAVDRLIQGLQDAIGTMNNGTSFVPDYSQFTSEGQGNLYSAYQESLRQGTPGFLGGIEQFVTQDGRMIGEDPSGRGPEIPAGSVPLDEYFEPSGDTATSRFGRTMGVHNRLSSMIPGRRSITSGLRSFNLGSMSSDHLTGNAIDMVGNNLGAYQQAMKGMGGYAEFHGGTNNRHLHAVPPHGDTYSPANVSSGMGGGASTINVTVNAAPGMNEEAVAMAVARRIERQQQMMRERT